MLTAMEPERERRTVMAVCKFRCVSAAGTISFGPPAHTKPLTFVNVIRSSAGTLEVCYMKTGTEKNLVHPTTEGSSQNMLGWENRAYMMRISYWLQILGILKYWQGTQKPVKMFPVDLVRYVMIFGIKNCTMAVRMMAIKILVLDPAIIVH